MYYLGIDWGKSKCGIAIADKENMIASSYRQVAENDVRQEIFDFAQKEKVKKIIVGVHLDLMKNDKFNKFLDQIKQIGVTVELENEDFSTQVAQANLKDVKEKGISKEDDIEAARVILQGWLDKLKSNSKQL